MSEHRAAVLPAPYRDLESRTVPDVAPADGEVAIRVRAIAVNPLDWIIQVAGPFAYRWLDYPAVVGTDVAGDIVAVGPSVTRLRVGDRVLAHVVGTDRDRNRPAEGGFQERVVAMERLTVAIPDGMAFAAASVLPLGLSTAANALFGDGQLGLRPPTAGTAPTGEAVLVWGGSTSVGANAIQLARAAGYDVVTTASPHNAEYVRSLGAEAAFDYRDDRVVERLADALRGRTVAGAVAIGAGSASRCAQVLATTTGPRALSAASTAVSLDALSVTSSRTARLRHMTRVGLATAREQLRCRRLGVKPTFANGSAVKADDVGLAVYRDFLPAALAEGRYRPAPPPRIVGDGLEHLQAALEQQRAGVSAAKLVVTLP